jgi:hypothetical protein
MFNMTAIAEDIIVHIVETRPLGSPSTIGPDDAHIKSELRLICTDFITGNQATAVVTHIQAGAILALLVGGEDYPEETVSALYAIAEPIIRNFPQECRPIP